MKTLSVAGALAALIAVTAPSPAFARFYKPGTGSRFLDEDPRPDLADPMTLHPFAYAKANPNRYTDPEGLQAIDLQGMASTGLPITLSFLLSPWRKDFASEVKRSEDAWRSHVEQEGQWVADQGYPLAGTCSASLGTLGGWAFFALPSLTRSEENIASLVSLPTRILKGCGGAGFGSQRGVLNTAQCVGASSEALFFAASGMKGAGIEGPAFSFGSRVLIPEVMPALEGPTGRVSNADVVIDMTEVTPGVWAHEPTTGVALAGAGGNWRTINEVVDPRVVRQLTPNACGPACGKMVLADRGIDVFQSNVAAKAGRVLTSVESLSRALTALSSTLGGRWRGGGVAPEALAPLNKTGSWIAMMTSPGQTFRIGHFVVVDGQTPAGRIGIRDPYQGTSYEMTQEDFLGSWTGYSVWKE